MRRRYQPRIKRTPFGWTLWLVFKSLGRLYSLAFGGIDVLSSRRRHKAFARELNSSFEEIFAKRSGEIVPDVVGDKAPPFDYVSATVEFSNARFQFTYGRKELDVRCSPQGACNSWVDLWLIWDRASHGAWGTAPSCHTELREVVQQIDAHWNELIAEINS